MDKFFDRLLMLKHSRIFASVPLEDLGVVAEELRDEAYVAGEEIFSRGDVADRMYIVQSGSVAITLDSDGRHVASTLGQGEVFGEMALFDSQPRSASALVIEDAELLSLNREKLHELLLSYPHIALGLLQGMSLRLRDANDALHARKEKP
ncbi:MAG: Crp/Fnr family transcriptional regulator [Betaproteobacteria bacterium]|nr:Crp/Fnr family transcriptional regulator [Betaproteobacteria bacterium]